MKRIVCLWGGPGTGKTTVSYGLMYKLKMLNMNAELNREYIKDWVWEERDVLPGDQIYITAKQARKEVIYMRKGIDVIVTDSPLALTTFYGNIHDKYEAITNACRKIVFQHHTVCKDLGYKVEHYFLIRSDANKYQQSGRFQDEATAKEIDRQLIDFMDKYPVNYKKVLCDDTAVDVIVKDLQESFRKDILGGRS